MFSQAISAMKSARARSEARHVYKQLLQADDHLLRDIGVNRGDLQRAMRPR